MTGDAEMILKVLVTRKSTRSPKLRFRLPWIRVADVEVLLEVLVPMGASAYEYQPTFPIDGDGIRWSGFTLHQWVRDEPAVAS